MLDKENLTVLTDAISKIMNKESVTEEIEIELNEASITTSTDFDDYPVEKDAKKFNLKVKKMPDEGDDINGPDLMTLTGSEKDIVSYFVKYMGANKNDTLKDLEQEFGESKIHEAKVGIQVVDVKDSIGGLKKVGVKANASRKLDDEIEVDTKDKKKVVKWMMNSGWDKDDIEDLYPELLENLEITEKLKAARGKSVLDIDFAGDDTEMDGMSKKYKIKMKKGKIKGTALVAGENKNILAYLQSDDYEMDDENIADIYPEVVAEAYDRNKLVNKMMKPIKDKEALKGKGKTKKEASGDKEAYQKFFMAALKKFGVESQAELKGDKEKEFYDYIDKNWDAKNEDLEEKQKPYVSSMDGKFDVLDAKGKVAFSTKNSKEAEKFLKVNYKMLMKETDEDLEESINEAKKVEASDNVYNLNNNQGQKPLRDYLNDRFKIPASKFLERIGFSGDTLVAGDKTVMNGVLSNKRLKVGDLVKALEKVLKKKAVKESVNEDVGANGHAGPVQDINQGLSPKAKLVKAFQEPETPEYADANKTALSTFANIMNSVNVAMDYRASDNKVQDVAPENTIQKLANSTK